MKIDDDYGLVASDDELNIYRRLDKQQKYNKKHKKASKRKSNTDKRKDAFYDDRKWRYAHKSIIRTIFYLGLN